MGQFFTLFGHDLRRHRAQQITASGIEAWQWFVAMDADNLANLLAMGAPKARVLMMRRFEAGDGLIPDVPDPYYGGPDGFDRVYAMLRDNADPMLDFLLEEGS